MPRARDLDPARVVRMAPGFTPHDRLCVGPCAIHRRHHYAIDAEGLIHKCAGFVGKPAWATGDVATGLTSRHEQLAERAGEECRLACDGCGCRPACAGACLGGRDSNSYNVV